MFIHDGLPVYKYVFKNGSLDNGAGNADNKCFCRKDKCLKPGLIDVTDCYYGKLPYPGRGNRRLMINAFRFPHRVVVSALLPDRPNGVGRRGRAESRSETARNVFPHKPGT